MPCKFPGCKKPHGSYGYCSTHVAKLRRDGDPEVYPNGFLKCKLCDRPVSAHMMCKSHYDLWRKANPDKMYLPKPPKGKCSVEYCKDQAERKEMCLRHYYQMCHYGKILLSTCDQKNFVRIEDGHAILKLFSRSDPNAETLIDIDDLERVLKSHWTLTKNEYAKSDKLGMLHRFVLNLPSHTLDKRIVHHINHNRRDNRKRNLSIVTPIENLSEHNDPRQTHPPMIRYDSRRKKWRAKVIFYGPYRNNDDEAAVDIKEMLEFRNTLYNQLMRFKIEKTDDGYYSSGYEE